MELYQAAFQHQRVKFAGADDEIKIGDVVDELQGLGVVVRIMPEVGGDAVFQRLCLADIDYLPGPVLHEIDAGAEGKAICLVPEIVDMFVHARLLCG